MLQPYEAHLFVQPAHEEHHAGPPAQRSKWFDLGAWNPLRRQRPASRPAATVDDEILTLFMHEVSETLIVIECAAALLGATIPPAAPGQHDVAAIRAAVGTAAAALRRLRVNSNARHSA